MATRAPLHETSGSAEPASGAFRTTPLDSHVIEPRDSRGREWIRQESIPAVGPYAAAAPRVRYGYDPAGRLTQRFLCSQSAAADPTCSSVSQTTSWAFDDNGNRTGVGTTLFAFDAQDRLSSQGSPTPLITYEHDDEGHLTKVHKNGPTDTYSYDVLGRLTQVQLASPAHTVSFVLDPLGRRVKRTDGTTTQRWVYLDALRPAAEYDGAGALVSRFVYLSGRNVPDLVIKAGTTYRVLTDERGSVRLVVNATTGAVGQRLDYDEWGVVTVDSAPGFQPFGFAGGMYDPTTGLVHFGARDYSPTLGRWTTKDPSGMAGGVNLYAYVGGDPINAIDPTGLIGLGDSASSDRVIGASQNWGDAWFQWGVGTGFSAGAVATAAVVSGFYLGEAAVGSFEAAGGFGGLAEGARRLYNHVGGGYVPGNSCPRITSATVKASEILKEVNRLDAEADIKPNASAILTQFFKANKPGTPTVFTPGITRDLLLIYQQVALEAQDPIGEQARRLQVMSDALEQIQ